MDSPLPVGRLPVGLLTRASSIARPLHVGCVRGKVVPPPPKSSRSLSMTGIVPPPPPVKTASTSLPMSGRLVLPFSKSTKSLSMTGIVPPPPPVKTSLRPSTSNPKRLSSQIPENTIWSGKRRKSSGTPMPSTQATSSQDHSAPLPYCSSTSCRTPWTTSLAA